MLNLLKNKNEIINTLFLSQGDVKLLNTSFTHSGLKDDYSYWNIDNSEYSHATLRNTVNTKLKSYHNVTYTTNEILQSFAKTLGYDCWYDELEDEVLMRRLEHYSRVLYKNRWASIYELLKENSNNVRLVNQTTELSSLDSVAYAFDNTYHWLQKKLLLSKKGLRFLVSPDVEVFIKSSSSREHFGLYAQLPENTGNGIGYTYRNIPIVSVDALINKPSTIIACVADGSKNSAIGYAYDSRNGYIQLNKNEIEDKYSFESEFFQSVCLIKPEDIVCYFG